MTFRDQNPISTTSEHVQMLQRLRTCCMSLIDKSVKWRRVTANHTAIIQLLTIYRVFIASFITCCFRHFIISQTSDLVYRLVSTRVCFWIIIFDKFNYYIIFRIIILRLFALYLHTFSICRRRECRDPAKGSCRPHIPTVAVNNHKPSNCDAVGEFASLGVMQLQQLLRLLSKN